MKKFNLFIDNGSTISEKQYELGSKAWRVLNRYIDILTASGKKIHSAHIDRIENGVLTENMFSFSS